MGKYEHVLVIGAGFAGLAAALRLAGAGRQVTVVEALPGPGGKAALGWPELSSGPSVLTMPQVLRALAARTGLPEPTLTPCTPTTAYFWPGGRCFYPEAQAQDPDLKRTLSQLSASEAAQYRRLLALAERWYGRLHPTFVGGPPPGRAQLSRFALRSGMALGAARPLHRLIGGGELAPFWLRFATYLGANPYRAPALLHNIAWVELGLGVWESPGGPLALAHALEERARALGVNFVYSTRVDRILTNGNRVLGLHSAHGTLGGDGVVSSADRAFTLRLLDGTVSRETSGLSACGVQLRFGTPPKHAHTVLFGPDYRQEWRDIAAGRLPADPTLYLHRSAEGGLLVVNAPPRPGLRVGAEQVQPWLDRLAEHGVEATEHRVLSPADYAALGERGALYGRAPHSLGGALRHGWRLPPYRNIRQVGGTVHPGGGVPLSLQSGWNGAGHLLKLPHDDLTV